MTPRRQYRVRWQRLGMSRAKVRMYETEDAARRCALKLQGRMAEAYPDLDPEDTWCCATSNYACPCGGETYVERWKRESALVPPLVLGPEVDSREVGEWKPDVRAVPALVPDDVRERFEDGGRRWPIPAATQTVAGLGDDPAINDDIPW